MFSWDFEDLDLREFVCVVNLYLDKCGVYDWHGLVVWCLNYDSEPVTKQSAWKIGGCTFHTSCSDVLCLFVHFQVLFCENLDIQLDSSMTEFLNCNVKFDSNSQQLVIPELLHLYQDYVQLNQEPESHTAAGAFSSMYSLYCSSVSMSVYRCVSMTGVFHRSTNNCSLYQEPSFHDLTIWQTFMLGCACQTFAWTLW